MWLPCTRSYDPGAKFTGDYGATAIFYTVQRVRRISPSTRLDLIWNCDKMLFLTQ